MIILMLCVMSYYVFEAVCNHHSYFINGHQLFWFGCAMIGGPVIGLCGNCSRTREDFIGNICRNILPEVFITEAFSKLFHISDYRHMIPAICLQMGIGIVIYVMLNRMKTLKKENMIAFICLLIPGSIGFELLRRIG